MRIEKTNDAEMIASLNEPVQTLHHQLYPEKFKKFNYIDVYEYFSKIIDDISHSFFVCYLDSKAVGYIWFSDIEKQETAFSKSSRYIYVQQVSVNKNCRGLGIGKKLFNEVIKYAEEKSIKRIGLDYWVKNTLAKKIYRQMGFEIEKEITYLNL